MEIKRSGSQPSTKGPTDWFTVTVHIDPLFEAPEPARVRDASVTFEPGARTALAYTSARSDVDRHVGPWMGAARRRTDRRNWAGRCDLVCAGRKTLAWRKSDVCDDAYRHSGGFGRKSG